MRKAARQTAPGACQLISGKGRPPISTLQPPSNKEWRQAAGFGALRFPIAGGTLPAGCCCCSAFALESSPACGDSSPWHLISPSLNAGCSSAGLRGSSIGKAAGKFLYGSVLADGQREEAAGSLPGPLGFADDVSQGRR